MQVADHLLNVPRGLLGLLRKYPHLGGHHGKSAPMIPGPRRFDGRVQGQQVGLLGNAANDVQHGGNPIAFLFEFINDQRGVLGLPRELADQGDGAFDLGASLGGAGIDPLRQLRRIVGAVRHLAHGGAHLVDRRGHQFGALTLLLDALAGLHRHRGRLLRRRCNLRGGVADFLHHATDLLRHAVEVARDLTEFILAFISRPRAEIALCQVIEHAVEVAHRRIDHADDQPGQHRHRQQGHDHRANGQPQGAAGVIPLVHRQAADTLAQGFLHLAHQVNALGRGFKPGFGFDPQRLPHRHLKRQALQLADFDGGRLLHLRIELRQRGRGRLAPERIVIGAELAQVAAEARQQRLIEMPLAEDQAQHHALAPGPLFHFDKLIQGPQGVDDGRVVDACFQGMGVTGQHLNDLGIPRAGFGAVDTQLVDLPTHRRQLVQGPQDVVQVRTAGGGQTAHHLDGRAGIPAHLHHPLAHGLAATAEEHPTGTTLTLQGGNQLAQLLGGGAGHHRGVHVAQRFVIVHHKHAGQGQEPEHGQQQYQQQFQTQRSVLKHFPKASCPWIRLAPVTPR